MSIQYQYYSQGSSLTLSFGTSATTINDKLNYYALNHLAITATVDCYVSVVASNGAVIATATSSQLVMARTETIIPCVKGRSLSVIGSAAGTLYVTEFLAA